MVLDEIPAQQCPQGGRQAGEIGDAIINSLVDSACLYPGLELSVPAFLVDMLAQKQAGEKPADVTNELCMEIRW